MLCDECVLCGKTDTKGNEIIRPDYGPLTGQPICDSCWERIDY